MPIYSYVCPVCGAKKEALVKRGDNPPVCDKNHGDVSGSQTMVQVPSVPSPMQWGVGCKWN